MSCQRTTSTVMALPTLRNTEAVPIQRMPIHVRSALSSGYRYYCWKSSFEQAINEKYCVLRTIHRRSGGNVTPTWNALPSGTARPTTPVGCRSDSIASSPMLLTITLRQGAVFLLNRNPDVKMHGYTELWPVIKKSAWICSDNGRHASLSPDSAPDR